jgi:hypothetical protein
MTDLDRRVAKLRGWTIHPRNTAHYMRPEHTEFNYVPIWISDYSPETNLLQACALWNEARPEGPALRVRQADFSEQWETTR